MSDVTKSCLCGNGLRCGRDVASRAGTSRGVRRSWRLSPCSNRRIWRRSRVSLRSLSGRRLLARRVLPRRWLLGRGLLPRMLLWRRDCRKCCSRTSSGRGRSIVAGIRPAGSSLCASASRLRHATRGLRSASLLISSMHVMDRRLRSAAWSKTLHAALPERKLRQSSIGCFRGPQVRTLAARRIDSHGFLTLTQECARVLIAWQASHLPDIRRT